MTDLDKLIEAVERGCKPIAVWGVFGDNIDHVYIVDVLNEAYHGSLDAAKALHEELLPGWDVNQFSVLGEVYLWRSAQLRSHGYAASNPARAWLIAILKAYRSLQ